MVVYWLTEVMDRLWKWWLLGAIYCGGAIAWLLGGEPYIAFACVVGSAACGAAGLYVQVVYDVLAENHRLRGNVQELAQIAKDQQVNLEKCALIIRGTRL